MKHRWQIAISAAILAAVWSGLADYFQLITWVGFLGCTTFFAQPLDGVKGVLLSWFTNLSGVFWAWLILIGGAYFSNPLMGYVCTAIATAGMCLQASYRQLAFIPGTFVGCCTMFATGGDIQSVYPALALGALLGLSMAMFTDVLIHLSSKFLSRHSKSSSDDLPLMEAHKPSVSVELEQ
ncbi:DUF1097 domain-containing protein [Shewanella gelidii]|uniref:DUF1097 domain-containing protein n=1 Tax=Shewanella gelidii TaxID=1642821 RepID=A0A917N7V7_9GAMM|nr:DUF1097 domain-containing protein [Shewanella gelidii]MCL1097549.1 DUF1097 domain-containing protein [Shewanella gelidii]GGI76168.1 hypothetical protein GCM10009332_11940 [Shewanella gelidii]